MRAWRAGFVVVLASCGPSPITPVTKPPPPPAAKKSEPPRARWMFTRAGAARAQLVVARGTLRVGDGGRRWIVRPDGSLEHATRLLPADLVAVRREGERFLFLDARGDVHVTNDPIGDPEATRPGPRVDWLELTGGANALLGVERNGTLHRSTNGGAAWSSSRLALQPGEEVVALAADATGRALVLVHPQRLLSSKDDGATWTAFATPGIGAVGLARDAEGALWLEGMSESAKLGDTWSVGGEPARYEQKPTVPPAPSARVLAGERIVNVRGVRASGGELQVSLSIEPIGGAPSEPFVIGAAQELPDVRFTGFGSTVVGELYERETSPPTTRVVRTTDDGRTWETLGVFAGHRPWSHGIAAAPGWVAIGELCADTSQKNCDAARVKIGNEEWRQLLAPNKTRLITAFPDPGRGRIVVLGQGPKGLTLFTAAPTEPTLKEVEQKLPEGTLASFTAAADGSIRLVFDRHDEPWTLTRVSPELDKVTTLQLPFTPDSVDLAGDRGLAFSKGRALETKDGGEHWLDVGPAIDAHMHCAKAGCMVGDATRVGWDLDGNLTGEPLTSKTMVGALAAGATSKRRIECVAESASKTLPGELPYGGAHALPGDVRYLAEPPPDLPREGAHAITIARGSKAPQKLPLLGAEKKDDRNVRRWSSTTPEGHVFVRYAFAPKTGDKYNPVDVELAWYATKTGKTSKAKLAALPPFRVGSGAPSALHAIVDGGLLFMPYSGDAPLRFVRDDGKVESMPRPPTLPARPPPEYAFRDDTRVVLASIEPPHVTLQVTTDAGKSWQQATWTIGKDARLVTHDKKPALFVTRRNEFAAEEWPVGLLPFDKLSPDPPAMVAFDAAKIDAAVKAWTPCTAATLAGHRVRYPNVDPVEIKIVGKDKTVTLESAEVYVLTAADGSSCVAAIGGGLTADDDANAAVVIAPHDPLHSWFLQGAPDNPFEHRARAMSCTLH